MNDQSLAFLLAELGAELARRNDPRLVAEEILDRAEARAPEVVLRSATGIQLRGLGCAAAARPWRHEGA